MPICLKYFHKVLEKRSTEHLHDNFLFVPDFCTVVAFNHSNYQKTKFSKTMTSEK